MDKNSYKQIFKATSIFGGVQVFSIIINLLKSKIIAIFVGPEGVGIFALFQNPINLISQITGLGLSTSGIRDVAKNSEDKKELAKTIKTVRSWTRITGIIGAIFVLVFAKQISIWSFGNNNYATDFRVLSLVVFFTALGNENDVILKGLRRIKNVAKAGVLSSLCGLVLSVPLYYLWGKDGIVAVIVVSAFLVYLFNWYFANRDQIENINIKAGEIIDRGKQMASLGSMLVLANVVETLTMYITNMFVRHHGGVGDVGLFQAGMQITNISIGLVYSAMAGDYYPRLSAICNDGEKANRLVNQQAEIATLISTPILVGMMTFAPLLIWIFLSAEFYPVKHLICWLLLAAVFRASTWTIHYVMLAHGNTKLFFILVVLTNGILIVSYPVGYLLFGLDGLGIGYLIMMCINGFVMYVVLHKKYRITFYAPLLKLFVTSVVICLLTFLSVRLLPKPIMYILNVFMLCGISLVYFKKLDDRTDLIDFVKKKLRK